MLRPIPLILLCVSCAAGCASFGTRAATVAPNPVFVTAASPEMAWERTIDAIHAFRFPIVRESKLDGVIETAYVVGSGIFEPWRHDSIGHANRWEDTFQPTRRRLRVQITPAQGGYLISVQAFKEKEDVKKSFDNSTGGGSFLTNQPLQRDQNVVLPDTPPSGWIPLGRDPALESAVLSQIQAQF